ncbi:MAG: SAM-dependent methyltransferase [Rickettsiaceae bacterium]|nr:SAM-dependent methyltransferase [Rickettsiaceae bacterium]
MSDNQQIIKNIILQKKGVSVAEFISLANTSTAKSYYRNSLPIGVKGDFVTSSEISQMFGEIIALWILDIWQNKFSRAKIQLLELGPGNGTLMSDILRITKNMGKFHQNIEIYLFDVNQALIKEQKHALKNFTPTIKWVKNIAEIPRNPTIVIANEFFDALGVRQFIKKGENWYEIFVNVNKENALYLQENKCSEFDILKKLENHVNATQNGVVEMNIESMEFLQSLLTHFKNIAGIFIDYGYNIDAKIRTKYQYNSTIQALKNHKYIDVYKDFAYADISSHVDFNTLENVIFSNGLKSSYSTQRDFLINYGINIRHNMLKKLNPSSGELLDKEVDYLTSVKYMGDLFKILTFYPKAKDR